MTDHTSSSQPRPPARHSGRRAPAAWRDPALWAWVAVAVFALLPLTHAVAAPMRPAAAADTDIDDVPVSGPMGMPGTLPAVKKLSDQQIIGEQGLHLLAERFPPGRLGGPHRCRRTQSLGTVPRALHDPRLN